MFNVLSAIELSTEDEIKIKEAYEKSNMRGLRFNDKYTNALTVLQDIYKMRFKLELPVSEMSKHFGIGTRAVQLRLREAGWEYNRFESQQIAANKVRDYKKIMISRKKTLLKNMIMYDGSPQEDYVRRRINLELASVLECEFIVGVNNLSIADTYEVDIPIIVLAPSGIKKYALEVNGGHWHSKENKDKIQGILTKGYTFFEVWIGDTTKEQREVYGSIDIQILNIVKSIVKDTK